MKTNIYTRITCTMLLAIVIIPGLSSAQSLWTDRMHASSVTLEWLKPNFEGEGEYSFGTSTTFLTGRFATKGGRVSIITDLPYTVLGYTTHELAGSFPNYTTVEKTKTEGTIGNPYFGIESLGKDSAFLFEFGTRLPVTPDDNEAIFSGVLTDWIERMEAFITDAIPVQLGFNYLKQNPGGFILRTRLGMNGWIPTGDRDDGEFMMMYGMQFGYASDEIQVLTGFGGRLILTEEDLDFSERTFHQLGIAANARVGRFTPGLSMRVPLDEDLSEVLNYVFGVTLGVGLN